LCAKQLRTIPGQISGSEAGFLSELRPRPRVVFESRALGTQLWRGRCSSTGRWRPSRTPGSTTTISSSSGRAAAAFAALAWPPPSELRFVGFPPHHILSILYHISGAPMPECLLAVTPVWPCPSIHCLPAPPSAAPPLPFPAGPTGGHSHGRRLARVACCCPGNIGLDH